VMESIDLLEFQIADGRRGLQRVETCRMPTIAGNWTLQFVK